jgi:YesN/AraC family two-component response regulator
MKIFLIEDEPIALNRLKQMIQESGQNADIIGDADSVESALEWLGKHDVSGFNTHRCATGRWHLL